MSGINYRQINPKDVQDQVLKQTALESVRDAFVAEIECLRLERLQDVVKKKEDRAEVDRLLSEAQVQRARMVSKVKRKTKGNIVTDAEIRQTQIDHLNGWIGSLEREHAAHTARLNQRKDSLQVTGSAAPDEEEAARLTAEIANHEEALKIIESAWHVATERLDEMTDDGEKHTKKAEKSEAKE